MMVTKDAGVKYCVLVPFVVRTDDATNYIVHCYRSFMMHGAQQQRCYDR